MTNTLPSLIWPSNKQLSKQDILIFRQPLSKWEVNHLSRILELLQSVQFKNVELNCYFFQKGVLFKKVSTKTAKLITDADSTRSYYFAGRNAVVTYKDYQSALKFTMFEALRGKLVITDEDGVSDLLVNKLWRDGIKDSKQLALSGNDAGNGNGGNLEHLTLGNLCKQRVASSTNPNSDINTPSHHYNPNNYRGDQPKRNLLNQYFNSSEGTNETIRSDLIPTPDEAMALLSEYLNSRAGKRLIEVMDWVSKKPISKDESKPEPKQQSVNIVSGSKIIIDGEEYEVKSVTGYERFPDQVVIHATKATN